VNWIERASDVVVHLDKHLTAWSASMGGWFYALLFVIVFAETGLVITPFLPGDSLLFALGVLAAQPGSGVDVTIAGCLLMVAALCGDNVNYRLGRALGPRVFASTESRLLNKKHLLRAQRFYEEHGGKTIILARFIAIVRTFVPFVAGVGRMDYRRFLAFSVFGAALWVWSFLLAGYWLGNIPWVQENFSVIVWAIMAVTIVLGVTEAVKAKLRGKSEEDGAIASNPPGRVPGE
jgi:membrane-associated protein